jgi:O-antigen/teichoic acid export membrane protein
MTNVFLSLILNMELDASQSFYFFRIKKEGGKKKQAQLVTAILKWRLSIGLLITVLAVVISPLLNTWLFDTELKLSVFAVSFAGTFFFQIAIQSAHIFQLLFRPWYYLGITLFQSLLAAALSIGLIVLLKNNIFFGYFLGFCLGSLLAGIIGWWLARDYIDWRTPSLKLWPRILKFGLPLVPASMAFYLLETSDRWFLALYHGGLAIGVYAVGFKIAMAMNLVVEPFRKACDPIAMKSLNEPDSQGFFSFMARLYLGAGAASIVIITAFSPTLIKWLTIPSYHDAYQVVGVLAWKQILFGFIIFSTLGIYKKEKTSMIAVASGLTAVINVILQYILVPRYAGMGAALAIAITFLAWNLITLRLSHKLWPINYPWMILFSQLSFGIFSTGILIMFFKNGLGVWETSLFAVFSSAILLGTAIPFHHFRTWYKNNVYSKKE